MPCRCGSDPRSRRFLRLSTTFAAVAAVLGVSACDLLGPHPDIAVSVTARLEDTAVETTATSVTMRCWLDVTMTAKGRDGTRADWGDATVLLYGLVDDNHPLERLTATVEDMQRAFGTGYIKPGEEQRMQWDLQAPLPFKVQLQQRYTTRPAGESRTVAADARCGPDVKAGSAPVIESLTLDRATPEAGHNIVARYRIRSGPGLWSLKAELSSGIWTHDVLIPVTTGITELTDSAALPLSFAMGLGHPLSVRLEATDLIGQAEAKVVQSADTVADLSPPDVFVMRPCPVTCSAMVGDTFSVDGEVIDASPVDVVITMGSTRVMEQTVTQEGGDHPFHVAFPIEVAPGTYEVYASFTDTHNQSTGGIFVGEVAVAAASP